MAPDHTRQTRPPQLDNMSPGSSSSGRVRGLLGRVAQSTKKMTKKVFKPGGQTSTPRTSSPLSLMPPADSSSSLRPPDEPVPTPLPKSSTQSQQSILMPQPVSSTTVPTASLVVTNSIDSADVDTRAPLPKSSTQSQQSILLPEPALSTSAPTASIVVANSIDSTDIDTGLAMIPRMTGADAWTELKDKMRSLEKSFPPIASAVARFLEVADVFEVHYLISSMTVFH